MSIFAIVLNWVLCKLFQRRDIYKGDQLYLRRWFIVPKQWLGPGNWPRVLGWVPVRYRKIFLHMICLDDDRVMHDHPWGFKSRILAGEYLEHVLIPKPSEKWAGAFSRRAPRGTVLENPATHIHRLEVVKGPVWTLVLAGPSFREWGFWVSDSPHGDDFPPYRWVDWRTYLGLQNMPTPAEDAFKGDPWFHIEETAPQSLFRWECESDIARLFRRDRHVNNGREFVK